MPTFILSPVLFRPLECGHMSVIMLCRGTALRVFNISECYIFSYYQKIFSEVYSFFPEWQKVLFYGHSIETSRGLSTKRRSQGLRSLTEGEKC